MAPRINMALPARVMAQVPETDPASSRWVTGVGVGPDVVNGVGVGVELVPQLQLLAVKHDGLRQRPEVKSQTIPSWQLALLPQVPLQELGVPDGVGVGVVVGVGVGVGDVVGVGVGVGVGNGVGVGTTVKTLKLRVQAATESWRSTWGTQLPLASG